MIKDDKAQYSVDYLIAMSIFILTISFAFYYLVSAFTPYRSTFDVQASAYRVAMILTEDSGLNVSNVNVSGYNGISCNISCDLYVNWEENGTINNTVADWYNLCKASGQNHKLNTTIVRVGLADYYRISTLNSSYERCTPCVLNFTKVENFFSITWWSDNVRFNFTPNNPQDLERFYRNLSILIGLGDSRLYHFNVSLRYLNGSIYRLNGIECQIGYPIPQSGEIAKFERLVVIDKDVMSCLDNGGRDCINATSLKRLVVYVW